MAALLALAAMAGCAKPPPPIRVSYLPEAPCVRPVHGTCEARAPVVPRRPEWWDYHGYLPE